VGASDDVGECLTADDGHGVEPLTVGELAQVIERQDAGVLQLGGHLRLLHEAHQDVRPSVQGAVEPLQGDGAAQHPIPHQRDGPHPAFAQITFERVARR